MECPVVLVVLEPQGQQEVGKAKVGPAKKEEIIIDFYIIQTVHYCNINVHIYYYHSGG